MTIDDFLGLGWGSVNSRKLTLADPAREAPAPIDWRSAPRTLGTADDPASTTSRYPNIAYGTRGIRALPEPGARALLASTGNDP